MNSNVVREPKAVYGLQWVYQPAKDIQRGVNEVLVESELKETLIRLNPEILADHDLADGVIYKLRAVFDCSGAN